MKAVTVHLKATKSSSGELWGIFWVVFFVCFCFVLGLFFFCCCCGGVFLCLFGFLGFFSVVCNCLSCIQPSHKTEHSHCLLKIRALCDEKKAFYLTFTC